MWKKLLLFSIWFLAICGHFSGNCQTYQPSSTGRAPEDEFCVWLASKCPYLTSKLARPVEDPSKPVGVSVEFNARRLLALDDVSQTFNVQGMFGFSWQMPSCAVWNSGLLANETELSIAARNVKMCRFDKEAIWRPNLILSNGVDTGFAIAENGENVLVLMNGLANWRSAGKFVTMCEMDFALFPFDTVVAEIELFTFDSPEEILYQNPASRLLDYMWPTKNTKFVTDADIWRLVSYNATRLLLLDKGVGMTILRFAYKFERKQQYYAMTIFVPVELLMALQLATFLMPASGATSDRTAYSVTVNLAFTVAQQVINANVPKTSQPVYLFYYVTAYMAVGAGCTFYVIFMSTWWQLELGGYSALKPYSRGSKLTLERVVDWIAGAVTIFILVTINIAFFALMTSK